jgi:hypothetical protein
LTHNIFYRIGEEIMAAKKYEKPVAKNLGDALLNANGACGPGNSNVTKTGRCRSGFGASGNCNNGSHPGGKCNTAGIGG